jgi:hypothetical protein
VRKSVQSRLKRRNRQVHFPHRPHQLAKLHGDPAQFAPLSQAHCGTPQADRYGFLGAWAPVDATYYNAFDVAVAR